MIYITHHFIHNTANTPLPPTE